MHCSIQRAVNTVLMVTVLVLISGCVQLSPQQVAFAPSLNAENMITAQGSLSLEVFDERSSKVIGYRGGVYKDTSTIVSKYNLEDSIRQLAEQVISRSGMEITNTFPDMDAVISLQELSYVSEDYKPSVMRTTVVAGIKITVRKGNVVFENSYKTSSYADTVGYPTQDKNAEMLNSVFNTVLQRLFTDKELEAFLNNG